MICLLLSFSSVKAQLYSHIFTSGWQAEKCVEIGNDSLAIIGLSSEDHKHRININSVGDYNIDKSFNLDSSFMVSLHNAFEIKQIDKGYSIAGFYINQDTNYIASVFEFDYSFNLTKKIDCLKGEINYSSDSYKKDGNQYLLGYYKNKAIGSRFKGFLVKYDLNDSMLFEQSYSCYNAGWENYGGCAIETKQLIPISNNEFLITGEIRGHYIPWNEVRNGMIMKVDSLGNTIWTKIIKNDSTSCFNLLVSPLANGNYLATWQDLIYKPYKSPDYSPYPDDNDKVTMRFLEFNENGKTIRQWNLKEALKHKRSSPEIANHTHLTQSKDSSILIVGYTRDYGTNGYNLGYMLKLDKLGQFKWYRLYEVNIAKPYGQGEETLYLFGVTELSDGTFALAGEYRSDPSDSFPDGAQKGVVLFVDEYGCFEPGCQLTDNIPKSKALTKSFKVYPNPTSGSLKISSSYNILPIKVEFFDMLGALVLEINEELNEEIDLSKLPTSVYTVKILRSDGLFELHKIILN